MRTNIRVSCVQFSPTFGDTEGNIKLIAKLTKEAKSNLVVFPELISSGYNFRDRDESFDLSIDLSKENQVAGLIDIASSNNTYIVVGLPERANDKLFNTCILIAPSSKIDRYRKIHLFDRETRVFDPGNESPMVINTELGKIGMMICFDWIFPEICRSLALEGAQLVCHPSNLVLSYCQCAMFARSVENGIFTMTCNRIGSENRNGQNLRFTGCSQILSPKGKMLGQADESEETIISAEIFMSEAENKKLTNLNHLFDDRRPEFYRRLQKI